MSDIYDNLFKRNVLAVDGEINGKMLNYFRNSIAELYGKNCPDIKVLFSSSGGEVRAGLDIYDLLVTYPGEKIGIVTGVAASMAAVVLQACDKRYATHHSRVLIHHINTRQVGLDTLRDKTKIAILLNDLEQTQAQLYKILCEKTNKSYQAIRKECKKNQEMLATDAVKFGLLDGEWNMAIPIARI